MNEKQYTTPLGTIIYWTNDHRSGRPTLVLLPGLTADHRQFDSLIAEIENEYNLLVWDAPGHFRSRPFRLAFTMDDMARWLREILSVENIAKPVLVGQSMGGYVSQCYMELFPGEAGGYMSIDSPSLKRRYVTSAEIWLLRHTEPIYKAYPWKMLLSAGSKGCATTPEGQRLMREMMQSYSKDEYCRLTAFGYRILADAMDSGRAYHVDCPALYLCGDKDRAGSCIRYFKDMHKSEGIDIVWVPDAGHNSNSDRPAFVAEQLRKLTVLSTL